MTQVSCPICGDVVKPDAVQFTKGAMERMKAQKITKREIVLTISRNFVKTYGMCPKCLYKSQIKDINIPYR